MEQGTFQTETLKLNQDLKQLLCSLKEHDLDRVKDMELPKDRSPRVLIRASGAELDMFELTKAVAKLEWSDTWTQCSALFLCIMSSIF